jgi:WD40-like Beta Propeller Repeat
MNRTCVVALAALALAVPAGRSADGPKALQPVNLAVNTAADEDDPFPASNGLALYFTSNAKGKFDILVARRRAPGAAWGKGELLEDYVKTPVDDRGVFVTRERAFPQYLYYATRKDREQKNFDIYVAVKQGPGKAFAEPTPLNTVNTAADEMSPWLVAGKELYFSRKTKEGWRVFVARRAAATGAAGFGEPALVEDLPPDFHHAALTPDGRTMYLQGPLDKGRVGLFVSTKAGRGWGRPEPLEGLNHPEARSDGSPALSADGSLLYFASDRPGGKGGLDVWAVATKDLKKK